MNLRALYNKHCLRMELLIGIGICIWAIWKWCFGSPVLIGSDIYLYANLAQLQTTLLGFILTTLGIIFTQLNKPHFAAVRKYPEFDTLWKVFVNAMKYLGLGVTLAWIARIFGPIEWLALLNLVVASIAFLRVGRCIWVLENVIRITLNPQPPIRRPDPNL